MKIFKNKVNIILLVIIIILSTALLSFNYGYKLGEHKGYVMGVKKCVEKFEEEIPQTSGGKTSFSKQ